jgi:hypothetical protein
MKRALVLGAVVALPALATPPSGTQVPAVTVSDLEGRAVRLPDPRLPVLLFYEDKDAGTQNRRAREVVGVYTDRLDNRARFRFLAVADVGDWDWWPAKKYVLAEVRKQAKDDDTTILLDWKAEVRKRWGLAKGKSGVLLVAADGRVLFAGEGTLGEQQLKDVCARLEEIGALRR